MKFKKDTRPKFWAITEAKIQKDAHKKDKTFKLNGPWKKFLGKQKDVKIYLVDGNWLRNNIMAWFNHGGHGYVCEYIPLDEIWVMNTHPKDCKCTNVPKNRTMSENYRKSLILHEMTERELMKKGMIYWKAHKLALQAEKDAGYIKNPNSNI